jgi:O-antigen ligase
LKIRDFLFPFKEEGFAGASFCFVIFFFIPFFYSSRAIDPTQIIHLIVGMIILTGFWFFLIIFRHARNSEMEVIDFLWLAYAILSVPSIFISKDSSVAIFEFSKIIFAFFLFSLFKSFLKRTTAVYVSAMAVSAVCVFEFSVVICQKMFAFDMFGKQYGFFGTMTHVNVLSECMLLSVPLSAFGVLCGKKLVKYVSMAGLVSGVTLALALKTRAAWVGFGMSTAIVLLLIIKNGQMKQIAPWIANNRRAVLLTMIGAVGALLCFFINDYKDVLTHIKSFFAFESNSRFTMWAMTMPVIKKYFWFGVGLGNWRFYMPVQHDYLNVHSYFFQRPHNDFLWIFSESGVFALIVFLTLFIFAFKHLLKNVKARHGETKVLQYCALFGLIAYCIDSMFAFPKERPYNLVFLAFYLAVPCATAPSKILLRIKTKHFAPPAIAVCILIIIFGFFRYSGECTLAAAMKYPADAPVKLNLLWSIKPWAYKVDPFTAPVKYHEGIAMLALGNVPQAKTYFQEAYAVYPLHQEILVNLGTAYEVTGEREKAVEIYREAIARYPDDVRPQINLAVIEYKEGDSLKCAELLRSVDTNEVKKNEQSIVQYTILKNSLRNYLASHF